MSADADTDPAARPGPAGTALTGRWAQVLGDYRTALARADLSEHARRGYAGRVAGFLGWLAAGPDLGAEIEPLADPHGRDFAVRDYRAWLKTEQRAKPATINAHLTALDHFYGSHLRLGRPAAKRERIPEAAPQALEETDQRRYLRAAQKCASPRNTAIALLLLYTGLRVEELQDLDLDDVPISARRGKVVVRAGKGEVGGTYREVPLHRAAREALRAWLDERPAHRGGQDTNALFLNRLGGRLLVRSMRTVVSDIGLAAGLVHDSGPDAGTSRVHPHTLRHTMATQLLRNGIDIVTVADILGHARVDTVRIYTRSSETDRARAIERTLVSDE